MVLLKKSCVNDMRLPIESRITMRDSHHIKLSLSRLFNESIESGNSCNEHRCPIELGSLLKYWQLSKTSCSSLVRRKIDCGNSAAVVSLATSSFKDFRMPICVPGNAFNLEQLERKRLSRCFSPNTSM